MKMTVEHYLKGIKQFVNALASIPSLVSNVDLVSLTLNGLDNVPISGLLGYITFP